jgi:Ca-activated chloride channel family protein
MIIAHKLWLLLLPLVPLVVFWPPRRRGRAAVRFSSAGLLSGIRPSLWARLSWLPRALRATGLVLLIAALARPQRPNEATKIYAEGIAIQMAVDNSGSMRIPDFQLDGKPVSRLEAVKDVFKRFVRGGVSKLDGRPNDLVGLVTFANYPDVKCPLTLSHEVLEHEIAAVRPAAPSDDGTNIGDAVAWALDDLKSAKAKSKVLILLTDGVNEPVLLEGMPDPLDPLDAARIAQGLGIKIYTIGAGTSGGVFRFTDPESGREMLARAEPVDEGLLRRMAEITGGKFYRATDSDGLTQIYRDIDRLEKTRTESVTYLDYKELFPWLALPALAVLCLEQLLAATRLRPVP